MATQDQNEILWHERLNQDSPRGEVWRHLLAARYCLAEPVHEEGRFATLERFERGLQIDRIDFTLDALECLAEINECSAEFTEHLKAAVDIVEIAPTMQKLKISPRLDDHPKNRHIKPISALPLLAEKDRKVIQECLRAIVEGPFISNGEFYILYLLHRSDVAAILSRWPDVDDRDRDTASAINSTMANLLGYPHHKWEIWPNFISVSPKEVAFVFHRWLKAKGWTDKSEEDFMLGRFDDKISPL